MPARLRALQRWRAQGGIALIGYELFRGLVEPGKRTRVTPPQLQQLRAMLCDPGPDIIVLDEGHRLRDRKSLLYQAVVRVRTSRRLVLTGYPLQNHLMEYFHMIDFCCPGLLGTRSEFRDQFHTPITDGSARDSRPMDVQLAQRRTYVLTCLLRPYVLRRGVGYLKAVLPPKVEWVVYCRLSPFQAKLCVTVVCGVRVGCVTALTGTEHTAPADLLPPPSPSCYPARIPSVPGIAPFCDHGVTCTTWRRRRAAPVW